MKNLIPIFLIFSNFISAQTIDWTTSLGGNYNDYFKKVIYTIDNGYLCVGKTNSTSGIIPSSIEVCDLQGKIIHRVVNENTLNISTLSPGIYLLQIISHEKQNSIHQLIVQ